MTPEESKVLPLVRVNAAALKAKKAARATPPNKSDFVRAHPNLSASEVVALAAKRGLRLSHQWVYMVRGASSKPGTAPAAKRGPGRPRKTASSSAAVAPAPVKRGPGRPRKTPAPAPATGTLGRRGPGRPRQAVPSSMTAGEKRLARLVLEIGLDRTEGLLVGLKRALGA